MKVESATKQLNRYWTFILPDGTASGIRTVEIRIDGQPAGSQSFEIVAPESPAPSAQPAAIKPLSMDDIFRDACRSMVWVHKIDAAGWREDTAPSSVTGKNRVATAFQAIDAATKLQLQFSNGRKVETDALAACSHRRLVPDRPTRRPSALCRRAIPC